MAAVTLEQLNKVYPNGSHAITDLDLDVVDGEFLVLVGPSGCGKSTALRMIAGLEEISSGVLRIGDQVVNDLPPKDRDIAMVFQNYALYPHMTVGQNIGFALKLAGRPKAEINERVRHAAHTLELEPWLDRKPGQLSGGQRQRVAMGRAIVREPAVFLMDEPLSNLDAKLRVQMRAVVARLQRDLKTTTVYVTHDQVEAMTMGDRVAVLRDGRLLQVDAPETLYERPGDLFVAAFIGSPAMNLLDAGLEQNGDQLEVVLNGRRLTVPPATLAARPGLLAYAGGRVVLGIRPEHLHDPAIGSHHGDARIQGVVELRESLGAVIDLHVRVHAKPAVTAETRQAAGDVELLERQAQEGESLIVATVDSRSNARMRDTVDLVIDTERAHFFDPETGQAIWG
jgi:multiple sugar transport system ATP-binding protein